MKTTHRFHQKGIVNIVILVGMLVLMAAIPVSTKLVQQNQENRSNAMIDESGGIAVTNPSKKISPTTVKTCSSKGGKCIPPSTQCSNIITGVSGCSQSNPVCCKVASSESVSITAPVATQPPTSIPASTSTPPSPTTIPSLIPNSCSSSKCGDCTTPSDCSSAGCYWENLVKTCTAKVASTPTSNPCSPSNCGNCSNLSQCNSQSGCNWSYSGNYCEKTKPTLIPPTLVPTIIPSCSSKGGSCIPSSTQCSNIITGVSGCSQSNPVCCSQTDQSSNQKVSCCPNNLQRCDYEQNKIGTIERRCASSAPNGADGRPYQEITNVSPCLINGQKCFSGYKVIINSNVPISCNTLTNKENCTSNTSCFWNLQSNTCSSSNNQCNSDSQCDTTEYCDKGIGKCLKDLSVGQKCDRSEQCNSGKNGECYRWKCILPGYCMYDLNNDTRIINKNETVCINKIEYTCGGGSSSRWNNWSREKNCDYGCNNNVCATFSSSTVSCNGNNGCKPEEHCTSNIGGYCEKDFGVGIKCNSDDECDGGKGGKCYRWRCIQPGYCIYDINNDIRVFANNSSLCINNTQYTCQGGTSSNWKNYKTESCSNGCSGNTCLISSVPVVLATSCSVYGGICVANNGCTNTTNIINNPTECTGSTPVCCKQPAVDGECNASFTGDSIIKTKPQGNLCNKGSVVSLLGDETTGVWSWKCSGSGNGKMVSCSSVYNDCKASKGTCRTSCSTGEKQISSSSCRPAICCSVNTSEKINGVCNESYNNKTLTSRPNDSQACSSGTVFWSSVIARDNQFSWKCQGINGGSTSECKSFLKTEGRCGTVNKSKIIKISIDTLGLCQYGSQATLDDSKGDDGYYDWTCKGANSDATEKCQATKVYNIGEKGCNGKNENCFKGKCLNNYCVDDNSNCNYFDKSNSGCKSDESCIPTNNSGSTKVYSCVKKCLTGIFNLGSSYNHGDYFCNSSNRSYCNNGVVELKEECEFGCKDGTCVSGLDCKMPDAGAPLKHNNSFCSNKSFNTKTGTYDQSYLNSCYNGTMDEILCPYGCRNGYCLKGNNDTCKTNTDCSSNNCSSDGKCKLIDDLNGTCRNNFECSSGNCQFGVCLPKGDQCNPKFKRSDNSFHNCKTGQDCRPVGNNYKCITDARCGLAANKDGRSFTTNDPPASYDNLCASGKNTEVKLSGSSFKWTCNSSDGGNSSECSALVGNGCNGSKTGDKRCANSYLLEECTSDGWVEIGCDDYGKGEFCINNKCQKVTRPQKAGDTCLSLVDLNGAFNCPLDLACVNNKCVSYTEAKSVMQNRVPCDSTVYDNTFIKDRIYYCENPNESCNISTGNCEPKSNIVASLRTGEFCSNNSQCISGFCQPRPGEGGSCSDVDQKEYLDKGNQTATIVAYVVTVPVAAVAAEMVASTTIYQTASQVLSPILTAKKIIDTTDNALIFAGDLSKGKINIGSVANIAADLVLKSTSKDIGHLKNVTTFGSETFKSASSKVVSSYLLDQATAQIATDMDVDSSAAKFTKTALTSGGDTKKIIVGGAKNGLKYINGLLTNNNGDIVSIEDLSNEDYELLLKALKEPVGLYSGNKTSEQPNLSIQPETQINTSIISEFL